MVKYGYFEWLISAVVTVLLMAIGGCLVLLWQTHNRNINGKISEVVRSQIEILKWSISPNEQAARRRH